MVTVDYFFSIVSPWTYLGHERFEALAKKYNAKVNYKPADISKVFAATGGVPVKQRSPQRQAYRMLELKRWKDHLKIPLTLEPKFFPANGEPGSLVVIAAIHQGLAPGKLIGSFGRACWAEEKNIADPETIREIMKSSGLNADDLLKAAAAPDIQAEYESNTEEGIRRGVFGAPTWILRDEVFWGQDRLDFLERALAKG